MLWMDAICLDGVCGPCVRMLCVEKEIEDGGSLHTRCGAIIIRDNDYNEAEKPT